MHVLSAEQFDHLQIDKIFGRADYFRKQVASPVLSRKLASRYKGRQLCSLFYQPSTRTRLSFETAATKLGVGVISTANAMDSSSATKGETLEDTIKVINQYSVDAIVLRFNEVGGAKRAAAVSQIPIINAGDGPGEHPTQALLDSYTIQDHHGRLDNLRIVIGGDIERSRTIKSLVDILVKFPNNSFIFVAPPALKIRPDIVSMLKKHNIQLEQSVNAGKAFEGADVVYWNRIQKEYVKPSLKIDMHDFIINKTKLKLLPKSAIIMNPLPRVDEMDLAIDDDPRAKYFQQAGNGLYIRMALLDQILSEPRRA